jgi:hypothetical protein
VKYQNGAKVKSYTSFLCQSILGQSSSHHGLVFMPKRILDIGAFDDTQEVVQRASFRLIKSESIVVKKEYVCLSHWWNFSGQDLLTTRATYNEHQNGIEYGKLGTVYGDTVHALRLLGIQYLWIDSLCIIQDDAEDWETESKMMAKIYSCALFTLARQNASTNYISISRLDAQSHVVSAESVNPPVLAQLQVPHIWDEDETRAAKSFPLRIRGWVFQERLLSRCMVHFSDREISWECGEALKCQCKFADCEWPTRL